MIKTLHFHCHGPGLIPGQGARILPGMWLSQKKKKKFLLKFYVLKTFY